jgi:hypothetical protein
MRIVPARGVSASSPERKPARLEPSIPTSSRPAALPAGARPGGRVSHRVRCPETPLRNGVPGHFEVGPANPAPGIRRSDARARQPVGDAKNCSNFQVLTCLSTSTLPMGPDRSAPHGKSRTAGPGAARRRAPAGAMRRDGQGPVIRAPTRPTAAIVRSSGSGAWRHEEWQDVQTVPSRRKNGMHGMQGPPYRKG